MEVLLHYAWKHKIFPLKEMKSTQGQVIEVIDPGLHNKDAGPDFFNAKIKINGILWVGNIEIHKQSSDWFRHGHDKNVAYDSVILHVAEEVDCELHRMNGEIIPQLQLVIPSTVRENYNELKKGDCYPPCHRIIRSLPTFMIHCWMSALQTERLEQKSEQIKIRWEKCGKDWEKTLLITLARNFGFGVNSDAFERLGGLIPFHATAKYRDDLLRIEAIFFGQAGLLDNEIQDEYYKKLQKEYLFMAHVFNLDKMEQVQWRFLRLHPTNFPHIRIAQLAWIYCQKQNLFSQLIDCTNMKEIYACLETKTSDYWETHYLFGKDMPERTRQLSKASKDLLIVNTLAPLLFAYGTHIGNEQLCQRAIDLMEGLKAENNYITRMWSQCGLDIKNAGDSQALIQLKKEYCDKRKCLFCRIGYEYLKGKTISI